MIPNHKLFVLCWLACSLSGRAWAQPSTGDKPPKSISVVEYIALFREIAISEMERTGIPASIKMAQAIHESGAGNSPLAREANNHFGIKCSSGWEGEKYYRWDDEAQESCFRVYASAEESFVGHSEVLKRKHYAFLFDLDRTDYKAWAQGLRKAGYATDPKYPEKLISTIEKYSLHLLDLERSIVLVPDTAGKTQPQPPITVTDGKRPARSKPRSFLFTEYRKGLFQQNGATYAIARPGESALAMAERFGIPYLKFLRFNDMADGDLLMEYQYGYIQPKRATYRGEEMFHRIKNDERMYEIAQLYGIQLPALLALNQLTEGQEPLNGEIVLLREKAPFQPKLRPANYTDALPPAARDTTWKQPQPRPDSLLQPRPEPQPLRLDEPTYPDAIYKPDTVLNTSEGKLRPDTLLSIPDMPIELPPLHLDDPIDRPASADGALTTNPTEDKEFVLPPLNIDAPADETKDTLPVLPIEKPQETKLPDTLPVKEQQPDLSGSNASTNQSSGTPSIKQEWLEHKVKSGETLYKLSVTYKVSIQEIKDWNGLKSEALQAGQTVKILKKG